MMSMRDVFQIYKKILQTPVFKYFCMALLGRMDKICLYFPQEGPVLNAGITHLALHGQKSSKVKRLYAPNGKIQPCCLFVS